MSTPYSFLWMRFTGWVRRSFSVLWLVILAGYFLLLAGRSVYQSYQTQQGTKALQAQLADSQLEEKRLQALLVYYQTDSFKEKELRSDLLLQEPGEKVYALPESGVSLQPEDAVAQTDQAPKQVPDSRSTWRQWADYLLHQG
jgi:hypothetical protein